MKHILNSLPWIGSIQPHIYRGKVKENSNCIDICLESVYGFCSFIILFQKRIGKKQVVFSVSKPKRENIDFDI